MTAHAVSPTTAVVYINSIPHLLVVPAVYVCFLLGHVLLHDHPLNLSLPLTPIAGQCLAGGSFKRCGVDTLFYVTGTNTQYQLHHRPLEDGAEVILLCWMLLS